MIEIKLTGFERSIKMSNHKNSQSAHRAAKPMVWVKANDGSTYICPKSEVRDPKNVRSEELSQCMDESLNPQNN